MNKQDINTFLVKTFYTLLKAEENALSKDEYSNISISEMHLLDVVCSITDNGNADVCNMTLLMKELQITKGSVTAAIKPLVKKGYLVRKQNQQDRRKITVLPTKSAIKACALHNTYHTKMIDHIVKRLDDRELSSFCKGLSAVNDFFSSKNQQALLSDIT